MALIGIYYEHLSEVGFPLWKEGGRQVHARKRFGRSRECSPPCARRLLECSVSWRDHRHSIIRGPLRAVEERAHATHLRSLDKENPPRGSIWRPPRRLSGYGFAS